MSKNAYLISDASHILNVEPHVLRYWEEELGLEIKRNQMGHRYYTEEDIRVLKTIQEMREQRILLKEIKQILPELYANPKFNYRQAVIIGTEGSHLSTGTAFTASDTLSEKGATAASGGSAVKGATAVSNGSLEKGASAEAGSSTTGGTSTVSGGSTTGGMSTVSGASATGVSVGKGASPKVMEMKQVRQIVTAQNRTPVDTVSAEFKMEQFQEIMTKIIGKALEANNRSLSGAISNEVSDKVSERVIKQMDYVMRENEERQEERFRKLDESIRSRQKANAEAAAALEEANRKKKKSRLFGKQKKNRGRY